MFRIPEIMSYAFKIHGKLTQSDRNTFQYTYAIANNALALKINSETLIKNRIMTLCSTINIIDFNFYFYGCDLELTVLVILNCDNIYYMNLLY